MKSPVRLALLTLSLISVATACTDAASSPLAPTVSLKGGVSTGSGGGGGGGGGGTTPPTVKNGRIDRVSAAATCNAGSSFSVTLQRGFDDRIEAVIIGQAAAEPTGPAVPPSPFPQTSLGGYQSFRIADETTGTAVMSFGGTQGLSVTSYQITNLGRGLPAGNYTFTFTTVNKQENGVTDFAYLQSLAPHETCTATLNATLR